MKKIIYILIFIVASNLIISCEPNVELPVLTEDEYPRILGRWPDRNGDVLGKFGAIVGTEFVLELQFTPSNFCEGTWYLDGEEYSTGTTFTYYSDVPKTHNLKLVVKTPKYTTSREAILEVTGQ